MSWLTKFLGFDEIIVAKDGEIVNLYTQLHRKEEQLQLKDDEIRRLTDLILTEHGVIIGTVVTKETTSKPMPIGRRPSWRQVQEKFEQTDAQMAKDDVTKIRDYWVKKDQEAVNR
jgi:hypothetical protein